MATKTATSWGAKHVLVRKGDRSHFVRMSKTAMVRFMRAKRPSSTRGLRASLWAQRNGRTAGKVWEEAVKMVQEIGDLPTSGEYTYSVDRELVRYWPRDSRGRRRLRKTKHAWKLIPGQLTPNINIRELACHDGTSYIRGLMKYEGLSRGAAKARGRGLAQRGEKVRAKNGNRPIRFTSVYRSPPYEGRIGGAFGAHPRGYGADIPPPVGVDGKTHHNRVRASFECGAGYYPPSRGGFSHGDFWPASQGGGRRDW